ncbi:Aste57867_16241 [Aphanomyces stellatus]|uniref:Aste57867_16241 protein n=1 Tax=Aphanomyces stellatus TaxID=120398 RepID=A0A485L595_9STRA|nr:hypothetical protein As57867_016184 [Aphanomyces stellatus]VFT93019.1 Aste57867_16241 [Aphanomyces stellatus]
MRTSCSLMDIESLEFLKDLHFIATCFDTKTAKNDDEGNDPHTVEASTRNQHDIAKLKAELVDLKAQIHALEVNPSRKMTYWERVAKFEQLAVHKARKENEQLHDATKENADFIVELEGHLKKKQRMLCHADNPCRDESLACWLPEVPPNGDRTCRVRAMHAIVDREYRRMHSVFLRHGLLGHTNNVFRTQLVPQPSGEIYFTVVEHGVLAAPFRTVGAAAWRIFSGGGPPGGSSLLDGLSMSCDPIDDHLVYHRIVNTRHAIPCHANLVHKYFTTSTRDAIVSRSVLMDPTRPSAPGALVEDFTAWIEVEAMPGGESSLLTLVLRINLGHDAAPDEMGQVSARLERVSLAQLPPVDGSLAPVASSEEFTSAPPTSTLSHMHIVLERSMRLEAPFKHAINAVIDEYSAEHCTDRSNSP